MGIRRGGLRERVARAEREVERLDEGDDIDFNLLTGYVKACDDIVSAQVAAVNERVDELTSAIEALTVASGILGEATGLAPDGSADDIAERLDRLDLIAEVDPPLDVAAELATAIDRRYVVTLDYRKRGAAEAEKRIVSPWQVETWEAGTTLLAHDHERSAPRRFSLAGIEDVRVALDFDYEDRGE